MPFKKFNLFALFCFASFLFVTVPKLSAQNFEGVIYYEIPEMAKEGISEMPYMVKDSKVRMEAGTGAQKSAMLFMPEEAKMVIIIEKLKGFMTINLEDESKKSGSETNDMPKMTETDETKTIAGISCQVWEMQSDEGNYESCITKELGNFMMPRHPAYRRYSPAWAKEISEGGFMPLEVVKVTEGGKKEVQMKAVKVEKKELPDSLFEIPKGYKDMSGMMKGMMNRYNNGN